MYFVRGGEHWRLYCLTSSDKRNFPEQRFPVYCSAARSQSQSSLLPCRQTIAAERSVFNHFLFLKQKVGLSALNITTFRVQSEKNWLSFATLALTRTSWAFPHCHVLYKTRLPLITLKLMGDWKVSHVGKLHWGWKWEIILKRDRIMNSIQGTKPCGWGSSMSGGNEGGKNIVLSESVPSAQL